MGWWPFQRRSVDQEIEAELQYHLEMLQRDGVDEGLTPTEARYAAARKLGSMALTSEAVRDVWGWPSAEALGQDIRYTFRGLLQTPRFTGAAVLSLGLGLGLTTAIFTLVNSMLFHSLPYRDPSRLVMVWAENKRQGWEHEKISYPEMLDWERSGIFERVVGFVPSMVTITAPGEAELVHGYTVSAGLLGMLDVHPMLGRDFTLEESRPGGPLAVILRYDLWQRRYGGRLDVIGENLMLNDRPATIVGVMPAGFEFFNRESDLIFPAQLPAHVDARTMASRGRNWRVMARLKSGLSLQEAQSRAAVISAGLADQYPEFNRGWTVNLVPLPVETAGPVRPALLMLMAAVGLVLLIACFNVGSLLLAQAGARSKELAVRLALGATRWRLARQVFIESIILAVLGGATGVVLARLTLQLFSNLVPDRYSVGRFMLQLDQIRMDGAVFAFAAVIALGSAILFGILPAFRAANSDVNEQLKDTGRGGSSGRRVRRGQDLLVVAQVMVAVVLVIGASLLAESFRHLLERGPGFRPDHLKTVDLMLPGFEIQNRSRADFQLWVRATYVQVMDRVAALPGIEAVASVNDLPLNGFYWLNEFSVENRAERDITDRVRAIDRYVWPAYFETMGIAVKSGRPFGRIDGEEQPPVVVVNDEFVRHYLLGENPIGRRLKFGAQSSAARWYTIVGVVGGERMGGLDEEPKPVIYFSTMQVPQTMFHLIVRSRLDLGATLSILRTELRKINPKIAPYAPTTFDTLVLDSTWRVRCSMLLLGVLAAVSLLTAILGIFGVVSYAVSEREAEIGIRMALGASAGAMTKMITWEGVRLAGIGVAFGIALAAVASRLLATLLFHVRAVDAPIYAAVGFLLVSVAGVASWMPARRGARLDPMVALRHR